MMNKRKFLSLFLISAFLLVFALQFVAAQDAFKPIIDFFVPWNAGNLDTVIAKYFFWALLTILVYSILDKFPGLESIFKDKEPLMWVFAAIVGFLSLAYITPEEIGVLMLEWSGLGFTLGAAVPLIVLAIFTFSLATDKGEGAGQHYAKVMIARLLWLIFLGFILYKVFFTDQVRDYVTWYYIIMGVAALALFFLNQIFKHFRKAINKERVDSINEKIEFQAAKRDAEAADVANQ